MEELRQTKIIIIKLMEITRNTNIQKRRGFRLPQRSHLQTLKIFVSEKSRERCEKSGKHRIKSGNREILRMFIFFPVSAPGGLYDY